MVMILFEKGIFATAFFLLTFPFFFLFPISDSILIFGEGSEGEKGIRERDDPCPKNLICEERKRGQI